MKRFMSAILALLMIVSLCACGGKANLEKTFDEADEVVIKMASTLATCCDVEYQQNDEEGYVAVIVFNSVLYQMEETGEINNAGWIILSAVQDMADTYGDELCAVFEGTDIPFAVGFFDSYANEKIARITENGFEWAHEWE